MNKFAIIDKRFNHYGRILEKEGFEVIDTLVLDKLYNAVQGHADLQVTVDKNEKIVFAASEVYDYYSERLKKTEYKIIKGEEIGSKYPENIKYNVVIGEKMIAHKLIYTSDIIRKYYERKTIKKIDVNQGYTKCSVIAVDDKYITDDENIYKAFKENRENILKIRKGYVKLEGFEYGFIGGTAGYFDGTLYFCGDIKRHPDYKTIEEFAGCRIVNLGVEELTDVGTVILL